MNRSVGSVEAEVFSWIERVVVGLNLCPFSAKPFRNKLIRVQVFEGSDHESLLNFLHNELLLIADAELTVVETAVLAIPNMLLQFHEYNDFLDVADALLDKFSWSGEFQIASFHPEYQFAGTAANAAENLTNRSPYPLLHIIREAELEKAIESFPGVELIPGRNIQRMEGLSIDDRNRLFPYLCASSDAGDMD